MNRYGNLDPGGYSLLLHAWSKIDRGLVWLRLSPFLFFLLTIVILGRHAWELTGSRTAALLACFIPLAYAQVLHFVFEIRAYSMEVAGVVAAGYLLHRVSRAPSACNHLALGVVCAVFLTSRYSFVIVAAAVVLAVAWVRPRRLVSLLGLLVPILVSGTLIYRVALSHHLVSLGGGAGAPDYVKAWVLRGQPLATVVVVALENLFSPAALPVTLAAAGLGAWPIVRRWPAMQGWPGTCSFPAIASVAVLTQLISAALSVKGAYPWHIGYKWSLYLHGISMLCVLYLATAAWWSARRDDVPLAAVLLVLWVAVCLTVRAATYQRLNFDDLGPALERLNTMSPPPGSVFVTHYQIPALRYLYELGPYRGDARYPAVFRLERGTEKKLTIDAARECLAYVLSPDPVDELLRRLPGTRLVPVPGVNPPNLIGIDAEYRRRGEAPDACGASSAGDRPTAGSPAAGSSAGETESRGSVAGSPRPPR
jgi:hypothetical protein